MFTVNASIYSDKKLIKTYSEEFAVLINAHAYIDLKYEDSRYAADNNGNNISELEEDITGMKFSYDYGRYRIVYEISGSPANEETDPPMTDADWEGVLNERDV